MFFGTIGGGVYGERMRILSTGNVGIGTTNPGAKLDIAGSGLNLRIQGDTSNINTARGIEFWPATYAGTWGIYGANSGAGNSLSGGTAVAGAGFSAHSLRIRVPGD